MTQGYFIAGPCAIESVDSFVRFAGPLVRLFERFPEFKLVYKGSFDKANRTLMGSPRGVGLIEAEVAWDKLRRSYPDLMLTTDVHECWQARALHGLVDVIQIPAFLGRQTDLITAAAEACDIVNLKKPPWEGVDFFLSAEPKTRPSKAWFTHRGTGLHGVMHLDLNELIDMLGRVPAEQAFLDLTHTNRGQPYRSRPFAMAAQTLGFRNFFAEVHPDPENAISDRPNQLDIDQLEYLLMHLTGR